MAWTEQDYQEIVARLMAESIGVNEVPDAGSTDDISSLPAYQPANGTEVPTVVKASLELLVAPALNAAEKAGDEAKNIATKAGNDAKQIATNAADTAKVATTNANAATSRANEAAEEIENLIEPFFPVNTILRTTGEAGNIFGSKWLLCDGREVNPTDYPDLKVDELPAEWSKLTKLLDEENKEISTLYYDGKVVVLKVGSGSTSQLYYAAGFNELSLLITTPYINVYKINDRIFVFSGRVSGEFDDAFEITESGRVNIDIDLSERLMPDLSYSNGVYLMTVPFNGIFTSLDGLHYDKKSDESITVIGGNTFVGYKNTSGNTYEFFRSSDGVTWSSLGTVDGIYRIHKRVTRNTNYFFICSSSGNKNVDIIVRYQIGGALQKADTDMGVFKDAGIINTRLLLTTDKGAYYSPLNVVWVPKTIGTSDIGSVIRYCPTRATFSHESFSGGKIYLMNESSAAVKDITPAFPGGISGLEVTEDNILGCYVESGLNLANHEPGGMRLPTIENHYIKALK